MLAVVAAFRQEIGEFLKAGRFRESERPDGDWGRLRFYTSRAIPGVAVVEGGFGRDGATESVRGAIARCPSGAPDAIICAGFSAGATDGAEDGGSRSRQADCRPFGGWGAAARLAGGRRARYRNRTARAGLGSERARRFGCDICRRVVLDRAGVRIQPGDETPSGRGVRRVGNRYGELLGSSGGIQTRNAVRTHPRHPGPGGAERQPAG